MKYFEEESYVSNYIEECGGKGSVELVTLLSKHVPKGASLLELGSGPCNDLVLLKQSFDVTGSDLSEAFLQKARSKMPSTNFLRLDASSVSTDETFDCLYSNKVLHHFSLNELAVVLDRHAEVLSTDGFIAHSFWIGTHVYESKGSKLYYHPKDDIIELIERSFVVIEEYIYQEFEENDSLFVIAKKLPSTFR